MALFRLADAIRGCKLSSGDKVRFLDLEGECYQCEDESCFVLLPTHNRDVFRAFNFDDSDIYYIYDSLCGYHLGGDWPETKNLEDLTKILVFLWSYQKFPICSNVNIKIPKNPGRKFHDFYSLPSLVRDRLSVFDGYSGEVLSLATDPDSITGGSLLYKLRIPFSITSRKEMDSKMAELLDDKYTCTLHFRTEWLDFIAHEQKEDRRKKIDAAIEKTRSYLGLHNLSEAKDIEEILFDRPSVSRGIPMSDDGILVLPKKSKMIIQL